MLRLTKHFLLVAVLGCAVETSRGFSLLGPINEPYQVPTIGYNLPGDIGAPKNLGEEYRRNTPVMYYAADDTFWNYFGSNGVAAIDAACAVFNNLSNVSSYSSDLSEFPFNTLRRNWRAEALFVLDLKSYTMGLLTEQLGLAPPDRYVWTLHDRNLPAGAPPCPFGEIYLVIKRNFDPAFGTSLDQLKPTSFINGTLFSYQILEFCTGPNPLAIAAPFPVDSTANLDGVNTAVASGFGFGNTFVFSPYGVFYNGLTRDDVGGLRYLLRANNMNFESAGANTLTLVTNTTPQLLATSNLNLLASAALTNDPVTLAGLFPGLIIIGSTNYFTNIYITNFTAYFTNFPLDPFGTPAHIAFVTNVTVNVIPVYSHTFGNLVTIAPSSNGWTAVPLPNLPPPGPAFVTVQTISANVTNPPLAPVGSTNVVTNITSVTYITNAVVGDYVILPTNLCAVSILYPQLTNVTSITNPVFGVTNTLSITNAFGATIFINQDLITYFTNHIFVILPVTCEGTNVALHQGIEKISFVRRDFDSLFNRFWTPLTNEYTLNTITNNAIITQKVRRTVTVPDITFAAADLTAGPDALPIVPAVARGINFNSAFINPTIAGPGTIEPTTTIFFNNVGPIFFNAGLVDTNAFLDELTQTPVLLWGSFNGTTNPPVLYPNDMSILNAENQVLIQVTPVALPQGAVGIPYDAELQTIGSTANWTPPFTWSLAPGSPGLPPGLAISTTGPATGAITGTPAQEGFFDIVIRVTDAQGRTVDRSNAIKITP